MISIYTGTPGSGKSYHAIQQILLYLRLGKLVIANFPMTFTKKEIKRGYSDRFWFVPNENITIEYLLNFAIDKGLVQKQKEGQCLVVIDEAGGRFNCRDFKSSDRAEWIDFLSQHRKLGFEFVLVAQSDRMIDRQIRSLVESEFRHRKINNFGVFYLLSLLRITVFVCVEYWYGLKQRVGSEFVLFRKSVASHYDSMKLFTGFKLSDTLLSKIDNIKCKDHNLDVSVQAIYNNENE